MLKIQPCRLSFFFTLFILSLTLCNSPLFAQNTYTINSLEEDEIAKLTAIDKSTLDIIVDSIYNTLELPKELDLQEIYETLKLEDIYKDVNLNDIFKNLDWNKILKDVDWNEIASQFDWNTMMEQQCQEAEKNGWPTGPNGGTVDPGETSKMSKCMGGFNTSAMMQYTNTSCLMDLMMKGELSLNPQGGDMKSVCAMAACIDMNGMFKNVDLNCLYHNMDLNLIFKNYDYNTLLDELKGVAPNQKDSLIQSKIKANPLLSAIDTKKLSEQFNLEIEAFFSSQDNKKIFQNFYDNILGDNILKNLEGEDYPKLMRISFSMMKSIYPERWPLKYYIVFNQLLYENGQALTGAFDFEKALATQQIQQEILITQYRYKYLDSLNHRHGNVRTIVGENFEIKTLIGVFENKGMVLSQLGQAKKALSNLSLATQIRRLLIDELKINYDEKDYLQRHYTNDQRKALFSSLSQKYSDINTSPEDLLDLHQISIIYGNHPPLIRKLIDNAKKIDTISQPGVLNTLTRIGAIDTAFQVYEMFLDITMEKLRSNKVTADYVMENKMVARAYALKLMKGIYRNMSKLYNDHVQANHEYQKEFPGRLKDRLFYAQGAQALNLLEQKQWQAVMYTQIGQVHFLMEHYEESLDTLEKAWTMMTNLPNLDFVVLAQLGVDPGEQDYTDKTPLFVAAAQYLAQNHLARQRLPEAKEVLVRAKKFIEEKDFFRDVGDQVAFENSLFTLYGTLGETTLLLKEYSEALGYFETCQKIAQRTNNQLFKLKTDIYLANYYIFESKNWSKAYNLLQSAETIAEKLQYTQAIATTKIQKALAAQNLGNTSEAKQLYQDAQAHAETIDNLATLFQVHTQQGNFHSQLQQSAEALRHYEQAIAIMEQNILSSYQGNVSKQITLEKTFQAYAGAVENALKLDMPEKAYQYVQQAKARTLNDLFYTEELDTTRVPNTLIEQHDNLLYQLKTERIDQKPISSSQRTEWKKQLDFIQAKIKEAQGLPEITPQQLENVFNQLQSTLSADEVVVDFFMGQTTYAIIISQNSLDFVELGTSNKIAEGIKQLTDELKRITFRWESGPTLLMENLPLTFQTLYNTVWQPIADKEALRKAQKLVIIPDAQLYSLPFGTLTLSDSSALSDRYHINYSPSAAVYLQQQGQMLNPDSYNKDLLVIEKAKFEGDPIYLQDNLGDLRKIDTATVKAIFPDTDFLQEDRVTVEHIAAKLASTRYRYLYLATHAKVEPNDPIASYLALSDGPFSIYESFDLNLDVDVTVIAACKVGDGQFQRGAGLMGFTRGLMYAGTRQLLVPLWSVPDESTEILVNAFFKHLKVDHAPAEALQLAQRDLRTVDDGKYANPFYWGAFVLFGG